MRYGSGYWCVRAGPASAERGSPLCPCRGGRAPRLSGRGTEQRRGARAGVRPAGRNGPPGAQRHRRRRRRPAGAQLAQQIAQQLRRRRWRDALPVRACARGAACRRSRQGLEEHTLHAGRVCPAMRRAARSSSPAWPPGCGLTGNPRASTLVRRPPQEPQAAGDVQRQVHPLPRGLRAARLLHP